MTVQVRPYSAEDPNPAYQSKGNGFPLLLDEAKLEEEAIHCAITTDFFVAAVESGSETESDVVTTFKNLSSHAHKGICSRKVAGTPEFIAMLKRNGAREEAQECEFESQGIAAVVELYATDGIAEIIIEVYSDWAEQRLAHYVEKVSSRYPETKIHISKPRDWSDIFSHAMWSFLGMDPHGDKRKAHIDTSLIYFSENGYCFNEVQRKGVVVPYGERGVVVPYGEKVDYTTPLLYKGF